DVIREWNVKIAGDAFENYYWNQSYGGVFSSAYNTSHLYVAPNLDILGGAKRTILPAIARLWKGSRLPDYYRDIIELPDAFHPPKGYEVPIGLQPAEPITTPIRVYPASATATSA
ncbi:acid phosphatase, partial [Colletotrichum musicola]